MITRSDTLFLINPKAKHAQASRLWKKIYSKYSHLPEHPIDITSVNIEELIHKKNPKLIVIGGGDGAINSVCNIVSRMAKKPLLSIIPLGTGNAISYCLGVETFDKAIDVITRQEQQVTIDLMRTSVPDHPRGVFNISVGFDARIVFNKEDYKFIGIGSYFISGLQSWLTHTEKEIIFTIDKKVTMNARASSLVIANCPVIGQNYVISPKARLNDGFLDCTLFSTKYAYLTNLRLRGFKHPLYSELGKVHFKASHIKIEGEPFVQIDGDPHVQKGGIEIEILKDQVTFLRNSKENIDQNYSPFII